MRDDSVRSGRTRNSTERRVLLEALVYIYRFLSASSSLLHRLNADTVNTLSCCVTNEPAATLKLLSFAFGHVVFNGTVIQCRLGFERFAGFRSKFVCLFRVTQQRGSKRLCGRGYAYWNAGTQDLGIGSDRGKSRKIGRAPESTVSAESCPNSSDRSRSYSISSDWPSLARSRPISHDSTRSEIQIPAQILIEYKFVKIYILGCIR